MQPQNHLLFLMDADLTSGQWHLTLISIVTIGAGMRGLTFNLMCVCVCVCVSMCVFVQLGDGIDGIPPIHPWE